MNNLTLHDAVRIEDSLKSVFENVQMKAGEFDITIHASSHKGHIPLHKCEHKLILVSKNIQTGINKEGFLSSTREPIKFKYIKHCVCGKVMSFVLDVEEDYEEGYSTSEAEDESV